MLDRDDVCIEVFNTGVYYIIGRIILKTMAPRAGMQQLLLCNGNFCGRSCINNIRITLQTVRQR